LDNRFNLPEDARADLVAFKQRIEKLDFEHSSIREALAPPRPRYVQQSLWGKFNSLLVSLARLTDTRRRVEAMEDEAANFRQAVMTVVGDEFTKAVVQLVEQRAIAGADALSRESSQLRDTLREEYKQLKERADGLEQALNFERLTRQKAFTDFDRRLTLKREAAPVNAASDETTAPARPVGVESLLETFYYRLEERYRGSRDEIKQRLLIYRNDLRAARERTGASGLVVDIGCGRGELLEVLAEDKFQAIGVDFNPIQLDAARRQGVTVVEADALDYLRGLADQSVLAVTGIHIIEHIPFPQLVNVMQEVVRVLKKGGIAIFETPNPHNLIVGATTFYFDPTHIRQLPPEVMQILFEATGFSQVETRPLHPYENFDYIVKHHNINPDVAMLLFGPQDYAVIGVMG
jgi:O-antigen chain-terminating methyltransferase